MIKRLEGETWRQAVARIGREDGCEMSVLREFDEQVDTFGDEENAAFAALYVWGCCEKESK